MCRQLDVREAGGPSRVCSLIMPRPDRLLRRLRVADHDVDDHNGDDQHDHHHKATPVNYPLNPEHPAFARLRFGDPTPFRLDRRLL